MVRRRSRMPFTRRALLAAPTRAALTLSGAALVSRLLGTTRAEAEARSTLEAYLDTLIPADELGPGALDLDVPEALETALARDASYRQLLDLGCAWLDDQAAFFGEKGFSALGENERSRIVLLAADGEPGSLERTFFETTRRHVFRLYWTRPDAWAGIGYDGPPQPDGFMDYAEPPAKR